MGDLLRTGYHLTTMDKHEEALKYYQLAYNNCKSAEKEDILNNCICTLIYLGRRQEGLDLLNAMYPNSQHLGTLFNKATLYLGMGYWTEAWKLYRNRRVLPRQKSPFLRAVSATPIGVGGTADTLQAIQNQPVFLFHEQGFGDNIMFMRYAQLLERDVSSLYIGVEQRLHRLMECLVLNKPFKVISQLNFEAEKPTLTADRILLPVFDCPYLYNTTTDTVPASIPYFKIPQNIIEQHKLPATGKPKIGLVWAGSSNVENARTDCRRSMPYACLSPVLEHADKFDFVSLQMPDHRVADPRLQQPLNNTSDFLDSAGLIEQLDLIISVDSAIAHLGGALGKPIWLLSRFDQCWRWFWDGRTTSPWYPTMKIFQQKEPYSWPDVVNRVVTDLANLELNK